MLFTRIFTISDSLINIDLSICASFSVKRRPGRTVWSAPSQRRHAAFSFAGQPRRGLPPRGGPPKPAIEEGIAETTGKRSCITRFCNRAICALSLLQRFPFAVFREELRPGEGEEERRRVARASVSRAAFRSLP